MSTRFTKAGVPLVDSLSLQLVQTSATLNDRISRYLVEQLVTKGYESITPSLLSFLGALECGDNFGSEIARNLGVSRQMVAKTVKELSSLGFLQQTAGRGKQKLITFTDLGEQLMADTRQLLADIDQKLFGPSSIDETNALILQLKTLAARIP